MRRHQSGPSLARRLWRANVVLLVVAMLAVIPLLSPFAQGDSGRALRNGLFQTVGVLLLVALLARVEFRGGRARLGYLARTGVNAPVAALLIWAVLAALLSRDRAFAAGELLRLGTGALIYFAVALYVDSRSQLRTLIDCLLGMVILVSGYGLLLQGSAAADGLRLTSIFPNAHHLSAVLTVLFPLLTGLALGEQDPRRRIAAIAAAVLCAAGLLLSQQRSAWISVAVGILVMFFLRNWSQPGPVGQWRATVAVAATGLLVAVGFLAVTDAGTIISRRAEDISAAAHGQDASFAWRVRKWRGTAAMVAQRPILGWGPGQFVLNQLAFTHLGSPVDHVRQHGASFDDMAYNEYLQTAAELGLPGLALYLLVLASFFSKTSRALCRLPEGLRRTVLLGAMAGVGAQMVDALANGSWRYSECSVFFWLVLGLGIAATRMTVQSAARNAPAGAEARPAAAPPRRQPAGTARA
jgi:putative inorganic carbon (hco3(-)) transporter